MGVLQQREVAVERALRDEDRAEALDRHVGERIEVVEHDAVLLAEHALVVGLERVLRRGQGRALRIVDEVEHEPGALAPIAERVEPLQAAHGSIEHAFAALTVDVLLQIARHGRDDLDAGIGEELREVFLAGHLQDREVAAVDHPQSHDARPGHEPAEMRIELGRTAGDVDR